MENLKKLIEGFPCELLSPRIDAEISGSCVDSRKAKEGFLFFALKGHQQDGALFVSDAISRGASAVITDCPSIKKIEERFPVPIVYCENGREAMGNINRVLYGDPSSQLSVIGVTGTNGKTTTVFLIEHMLRACGRLPGIITTVQYSFGNRIIPAEMTTPDSPDLFDLLSQMVRARCDTAVMEVSSQAAHQKRVAGVSFALKAFTNLSQDHLDYHQTMEAYCRSKESFLFDGSDVPIVLNADDKFGKELFLRHAGGARIIRYGMRGEADYQARFEESEEKQKFTITAPQGDFRIQTRLIGAFNVYNILAAFAVCSQLGCDMKKAAESLKTFRAPAGRMTEIACRSGGRVFVDYAHTPDALKNALETLRSFAPEKLVLCFGCGGERDKGKREVMGKIASLLADEVFVTSDNPRGEDPDGIMAAILRGAEKKTLIAEKDRKKALRMALEILGPKDILLVAGKGHENYQIIGSQYIPFNDIEVIRDICRSQAGGE